MDLGERTDRRIRKTKRAVKIALAELLAEKSLEEISVVELCRTADIDRKTFYNHYAGVYSVTQELEEELLREVETLLNRSDLRKMMVRPYLLFERITAVLNADLDLYGELMRRDGPDTLIGHLENLLCVKFRDAAVQLFRFDEKETEIAMRFAVTGTVSVYRDWFLSERETSINEISEILGNMCMSGFRGMKRGSK